MTTLWQFMNQLKPILCKHYGTYRVYYAYLIVWTFLYLWIYLFFFFSPDLCCDTWARFVQILLRFGRLLRIGGVVANGVAFSLRSYGVSLYCTIPRQFILHLHRYNILRSPRGTQCWVSRSKKMSRQGVAIFGLF